MERNSNADRDAIEVLRMNEKLEDTTLIGKKKKSSRNVAFISQSSFIQDFSGLLPKPVEILTYAPFLIVWVCVDEYPQGSTSLGS